MSDSVFENKLKVALNVGNRIVNPGETVDVAQLVGYRKLAAMALVSSGRLEKFEPKPKTAKSKKADKVEKPETAEEPTYNSNSDQE